MEINVNSEVICGEKDENAIYFRFFARGVEKSLKKIKKYFFLFFSECGDFLRVIWRD